MKEQTVPWLLKNWPQPHLVLPHLLTSPSKGLSSKTALVRILFKFGGWHLLLISLVLSIRSCMAEIPSKIDIPSCTCLIIFG